MGGGGGCFWSAGVLFPAGRGGSLPCRASAHKRNCPRQRARPHRREHYSGQRGEQREDDKQPRPESDWPHSGSLRHGQEGGFVEDTLRRERPCPRRRPLSHLLTPTMKFHTSY